MSDLNDLEVAYIECRAAQDEANGGPIQATINGQLVGVIRGIISSERFNAEAGGWIDGATNAIQAMARELNKEPGQENTIVMRGVSYNVVDKGFTGGIWTLTIGDHEA